jgi:hypothetical protein
MILKMTFSRRHRRWAFSGSRMMSVGNRAERMLASRLVELERRLDTADEQAAEALWAEYRATLDLWLRVRAPKESATPPITVSQLKERFGQRGVVTR